MYYLYYCIWHYLFLRMSYELLLTAVYNAIPSSLQKQHNNEYSSICQCVDSYKSLLGCLKSLPFVISSQNTFVDAKILYQPQVIAASVLRHPGKTWWRIMWSLVILMFERRPHFGLQLLVT